MLQHHGNAAQQPESLDYRQLLLLGTMERRRGVRAGSSQPYGQYPHLPLRSVLRRVAIEAG